MDDGGGGSARRCGNVRQRQTARLTAAAAQLLTHNEQSERQPLTFFLLFFFYYPTTTRPPEQQSAECHCSRRPIGGEGAKGNTATTRPTRLPKGARWVGRVAGWRAVSSKPYHFHCLRRRLRKVRTASLLLLSNDSIAAVPIALSRSRFSIRCVFCHWRRAPSASHRDYCLSVFKIYYLYRFRRPRKTTAESTFEYIFARK